MTEANQSPVITFDQSTTVEIHQEKHFVMRETDWSRIRTRVDGLAKQRKEFSAVGWACVGILVSAVFGLIGWAPVYDSMGEDAQAHFAWIYPAIIFLGVLGVLLGAGMFWAAHAVKESTAVSASVVLDDMDQVHPIGRAAGT